VFLKKTVIQTISYQAVDLSFVASLLLSWLAATMKLPLRMPIESYAILDRAVAVAVVSEGAASPCPKTPTERVASWLSTLAPPLPKNISKPRPTWAPQKD
jgi:hypothetical protein